MADSAHEHISIEAPLDDCYAAISDFERYAEWAPDIKATRVIARDDCGRASEVEFRAAAMGRSVLVHLRYDYSAAPERLSWELVEGDTVRRYEGSYQLTALEGQSATTTDVDYELTVELLVPLPGFVKRRAESKIMKAALPELKHHVESGAAQHS